ncbi:MAG: phosphoglucosamine mutase [Gammaproteobacteria bacterium]
MIYQKKYFGTDGIRGRIGVWPMTPDWILKLGFAVGKVLSEKKSQQPEKSASTKTVLIGKDTRISGYMLESALEAGLSAAGVRTLLLGPLPTAGVAYLTRALQADLSIVISASHNPYQDNGIKFFSSLGTKLSDELEWAIEKALDSPMECLPSHRLGKASRINDAAGRYIEFCKATFFQHQFSQNLKGLKIVVDCANGAGYLVAPAVFRELGAEVISIHAEPNGLNINENAGALYPQGLAKAVLQNGADLGLALDGDADRLILVNHQGEIVDGDEILYILAKWYKDSGRLKEDQGVVGTVMSNLGLELGLQDLGIPFQRAQVGDRHVLALLESFSWILGGESSGHILCLDAHTTGDGIVAGLRILGIMMATGLSLSELGRGFLRYPQNLLNIRLNQDNKDQPTVDWQTDPRVQQLVNRAQTQLGQKGRVLLRASGTEPLLRVMVEGRDKHQVENISANLASDLEFLLL